MFIQRPMPLEEFDRFVALPENRDHNFEYIAGEIVERVSNDQTAGIAATIATSIILYIAYNHLGHMLADGGYVVCGERYFPTAGFLFNPRQRKPDNMLYNPLAPHLAIEVRVTGISEIVMIRKIGNYMIAGTMLWVVDPEFETVDVYTPRQPRRTLRVGDVFEDGTAFPGFTLAIAELFSKN